MLKQLLEYKNFLQHVNYFLGFDEIILMIQQNYFQICIQQNFKSLSKIVLSVFIQRFETASLTLKEKSR